MQHEHAPGYMSCLWTHAAQINVLASTIACTLSRHTSSKHVSLSRVLQGATADDFNGIGTASAADVAAWAQVLMGSQLPRWERMLCYVVIPVTLLLSVVGVGSSVAALVRQVRQR